MKRTLSNDDGSSSPPSSPSAAKPKAVDADVHDAKDKPLPYGHFKWGSNGEGWACNGRDGEDCSLLVSH